MPSCVIPTCKNATGNAKYNYKQGISFHHFPCDEEVKEHWIEIVRKSRLDESWKPSDSTMICSIHFESKDLYETQSGLMRIRKGARPFKNVATQIINYESRIKLENENEPETSSVVYISDQLQPDTICNSNINDVEFDTSTEINLRSQINRRIKYLHKYKRKIKMLQQRNIQIGKNNKCLKESILKYLEKKFAQQNVIE